MLTTKEDITWLREVHIPHLSNRVRFALIQGNEDAPSKVECWYSACPLWDELPDIVWTAAQE